MVASLLGLSTAVTWHLRAASAGSAESVVIAEARPLLGTPIPRAEPVSGTEELRIEGASAVWMAPASPAAPPPAQQRTPLPAPPNTPAAEVDRWVQRLTTSQRGEMKVGLERMARYEPLIRHALAERGLPRDLLYLALIESSYLPGATSRVGAGGIWQFMPGTARGYGLEVSEYVDERRDPIRSTYAAVRHLDGLHRQFGSWHLAAAAYNAGDGRVGGVLRETTGARGGREVLYWMIRPYLPAETREYVPKLLAAARIARDPEAHGFDGLADHPALRFREVSVPGGVSLASVAHAAGVAPEAVYELNPHLIRRMTPPGRRWPVRVPAADGPDSTLGRVSVVAP